jgi:hypothetical protein
LANRDEVGIVHTFSARENAGLARKEFAELLAGHLATGQTGWGTIYSGGWQIAEFARALSVRSRTVESWLNPRGKSLPKTIDKILEVLFGEYPESAMKRTELKVLWTHAVDVARIARNAEASNAQVAWSRFDQHITSTTDLFPPPTAPSIGPGSRFSPTAGGYEISAVGISDAERTDSIQTRLYSQIQRRVGQLTPLLTGIGNSHPFLASEISDYMALMSVGLEELDVPAVWSVGSALREMLAQLTDTSGSMTPALEPEPLAMLNSLMRDDIAFMQGFSAGRALTQRVRDFQQSAKPVEPTRKASHDVLQALRDVPHLLAAKASRLVTALLRIFEPIQTASLQTTVAANETAYNFIIAAGRHIQSFGHLIEINEATKLALIIAGAEHPDVLEASIILFRDHGATLLALSALDGQIFDWLNYLITLVRSAPHPTSSVE